MPKTTCRICNKPHQNLKSLSNHLRSHHTNTKDYYDNYLKSEKEGSCLGCGKPTTYRDFKYKSFCGVKCSNTHEKTNELRSENHSQAYKDNPNLADEISGKRNETYRKYPEKAKKRSETHKKTLRDNPEIIRYVNEKLKEAYENNPEKLKRRKDRQSISLRNYYKKLQKNKSEETHYLYIMENLTKPIIKIGLCNERTLEKRTWEICRDFGESNPILLLKSTYKKICELESFLHDYFNEHCKVQLTGNGRTEWFDIKIMEEAKLIASSRLLEC